jgi:hypothetical protein
VIGIHLLKLREVLEHRAEFEEERGKGSALVFGHREPSWPTREAAAIWNRPWVSGPTRRCQGRLNQRRLIPAVLGVLKALPSGQR